MDSRKTAVTTDIPTDPGLGPLPWENLTISQVLLPVLCALFITIVIVVIACCLIQKKPKSLRTWRERSCHTIETLHDVSDHDIYDVIDEVNVSTITREKSTPCNDKLGTNYIIGAQLLDQSKTCDALATSFGFPFYMTPSSNVRALKSEQSNSSESACRSQESVPSKSCLPKQTNCRNNQVPEIPPDEGIYETLNRHWTLKSEVRNNTLLQNSDKCLTLHKDIMACEDGYSKAVLQREMYDTERYTNSSCCHSAIAPSNTCHASKTAPSHSQAKEDNTIVCQLTMFKFGDAQQEPVLIEKAFYHVQPKKTLLNCSRLEDISAMFQSADLKIVHADLREAAIENGKGLDLILKPLTETGNLLHHLRDKSSDCKNVETTTTVHEISHAINSQRCQAFPIKKAEGFSATSLGFSQELYPSQSRGNNDFCNVKIPFEFTTPTAKHLECTKSPEAKRISTKLGPLPPLPFQQCQVACERRQFLHTSCMNKSSCLHNKCSNKSSATPLFKPPLQNVATAYPETPRPVCISCQRTDIVGEPSIYRPQTFSDRRQKMDVVISDANNVNKRVRTIDILSSDFHTAGAENIYVTDTNTVYNIARMENSDVSSNHYYVLEPNSDGSSPNSDAEDT